MTQLLHQSLILQSSHVTHLSKICIVNSQEHEHFETKIPHIYVFAFSFGIILIDFEICGTVI